MNLNESLRDWINHNLTDFPQLEDVTIVTMGERETLPPPFLAIYETGCQPVEQNGSVLYGVGAYELTAELHTVPQHEDEDGTSLENEQKWRKDFFNLLGNRDSISFCNGLNGFNVFDIRATPPTTSASDGRLISKIDLTVIACPY